jgi:hypothetical protein
MDIVNSLLSWLTRNHLHSLFYTVRGIFIMIDLVLVVLLVFTLGKALEFRPKFRRNPRETRRVTPRDPEIGKRWSAVLEKAEANPPHSFALAIIEADKLTDEALKRMGFQGEHMADRLEHLNAAEMRTLEPLWRAHRLRNELVHAPDFEVNAVDARETLQVYGRFLKELGVL